MSSPVTVPVFRAPAGVRKLAERLGFALLAIVVVMALFGWWLAPYDPLATEPLSALQPPSWAHPFGTDSLGRDVFSRTLAAARVDLMVAIVAVLASLTVGALLGAAAGWAGGWADRLVGRIIDTIMAFPLFVLAVGIAAAMGNRFRASSWRRRSSTCPSMSGKPGPK